MGPFDDLKHAQRERLLFLEQCFTWRGMANRKDLVDQFGISRPQAAQDFRVYLDRKGRHKPIYDPTRKSYFSRTHASQRVIEGLTDAFQILEVPEANASLPRPRRRADAQIVARLYQAMKARQLIEVRYTSMTSGLGKDQWIAPTHFTSDGEAVHLRAYSFGHREYRNYLPIRFDPASSFSVRQENENLPEDVDWETWVRISLRPKRSLSGEQSDVVRREYGFEDNFLVIEIRQALEFYFDRRWGLDQPGARLERAKTEVVRKGPHD
jgi:hypothetical protein